MNLTEYLKTTTQAKLAMSLDVDQSLISQWLNGKTKITAERASQIEEATKGKVRRHELRPDLWPAPVRRSRKTTEA